MEKMMEEFQKDSWLGKIAYYPGCSLNSTAMDFNVSIKNLLKHLEIEFEEIDDWNCCGTTPAHNVSDELSIILSARNLLLAKKMGYENILCPCVSCYCKLLIASQTINSNVKPANKLEEDRRNLVLKELENMGFDISQGLDFRVYSIVHYLFLIKEKIRNKYLEVKDEAANTKESELLKSLKPVCYYGCVLLRPGYVTKFDSIENPTSMESILKEAGIESLNFPFKTECCGAILSLTNKNIVLELSEKILSAAQDSGANCIIVCCPLCQQNLDLRQSQINKYFKSNYRIPVFYISQILGLALGLSYKDMMIDKLFVEPEIRI
ncbi:MAG: CoB--CoM heterodisulfide reductase iron-sulfur subunit B family protein [Actinobacteria bacterium]|nr:CoB--CoM heterodisulfide reductase iron-sulfur subunit B family protein [Actinomycetota bacterium]